MHIQETITRINTMGEGTPYRPDSAFELTPGAREVLRAFREAKTAASEKDRERLLSEFIKRLVTLVSEPGFLTDLNKEQHIPTMLVGAGVGDPAFQYRLHSSDHIVVEGGTNGQRIFLLKKLPTVWGYPEDLSEFENGADLVKGQEHGDTKLTAVDGQPRWMFFPGGKQYGAAQRRKFVENFGRDIVDLLQEVGE